jgi:hypothetical protein
VTARSQLGRSEPKFVKNQSRGLPLFIFSVDGFFSGEEGGLLSLQRQDLHDVAGSEVPLEPLRKDLGRGRGETGSTLSNKILKE